MYKEDLKILSVEKDPQKGLEIAKQKLYEFCDKTTVLFLSGGTTPKPLYEDLAREAKLNVGAVAMVDERFGEPFHQNSNEKMIGETGLLSYLEKSGIAFYPILKKGLSRDRLAKDYDETVRFLFSHFPKSIGISGIGSDGHTAGIAPNRTDPPGGPLRSEASEASFKNPVFSPGRKTLLVSEFADSKSMINGGFGERITLTFNALKQMDLNLILAFGRNKKKALETMFKEGSLEEIPARIYLMRDVANKTVLITDQKI